MAGHAIRQRSRNRQILRIVSVAVLPDQVAGCGEKYGDEN
jgi:hypothetical protein